MPSQEEGRADEVVEQLLQLRFGVVTVCADFELLGRSLQHEGVSMCCVRVGGQVGHNVSLKRVDSLKDSGCVKRGRSRERMGSFERVDRRVGRVAGGFVPAESCLCAKATIPPNDYACGVDHGFYGWC